MAGPGLRGGVESQMLRYGEGLKLGRRGRRCSAGPGATPCAANNFLGRSFGSYLGGEFESQGGGEPVLLSLSALVLSRARARCSSQL